MSTIQNIYDSIQYRPDIQVTADDLIHVVNMAVRTIAKRLYVLESSLIIDQMSVSIFAEVEYEASLAFGTNTITDAAEQFIEEGFEAGMEITTDAAANPGPYRISTVAAGTLTLASSVTTATAATVTVTSNDEVGFLPSDFWGMADKPYISGKKYPLLPLPSVNVALQYTTGDPGYYKVKGTKIYVTPGTGSDYTIIADYFKRPTALTATGDTVPFNELFDDSIAEYIMRFFRGRMTGNEIMALEKFIEESVDLVASKYDKRAPVRTGGVDWTRIGGYYGRDLA